MKKNIEILITVIVSLIVSISGVVCTLYLLITDFIDPLATLFLFFPFTLLGVTPFAWVIEQIKKDENDDL